MTISFRRSLLHPILLFRTQRSEIEYKVDGQTSIHVLMDTITEMPREVEGWTSQNTLRQKMLESNDV